MDPPGPAEVQDSKASSRGLAVAVEPPRAAQAEHVGNYLCIHVYEYIYIHMCIYMYILSILRI